MFVIFILWQISVVDPDMFFISHLNLRVLSSILLTVGGLCNFDLHSCGFMFLLLE